MRSAAGGGPTGSSRIDSLVNDILEQSAEGDEIRQSELMGMAMLRLRKFMFERVYLGPDARSEHDRVRGTLLALFFQIGDEVPVMTNIAAVREAGERFDTLDPHAADATVDAAGDAADATVEAAADAAVATAKAADATADKLRE